MAVIRFTILGEPVAKGRPRFCVKQNRVFAITPEKTREAEADMKSQALPHRPQRPLEGPVCLTMRLYRAKGLPSSRKAQDEALAGLRRPITKPDWDNLAKLTDALNGIFWRDDAQIVEAHVYKFFSDIARTEIEIQYEGV